MAELESPLSYVVRADIDRSLKYAGTNALCEGEKSELCDRESGIEKRRRTLGQNLPSLEGRGIIRGGAFASDRQVTVFKCDDKI